MLSVVVVIGKVRAGFGDNRWEYTIVRIKDIGDGVEAVGKRVTRSGEKDEEGLAEQ